MKSEDLVGRITSLSDDIEFTCNGKDYLIIPYSQKKFLLVETPGHRDIECTSIEMLLSVPFFDGKSLREVMDDVELL